MFNIGGGELLVILLVALIVLGPTKLPEVARQIGGVTKELRRMSAGFQAELKSALDDPIEEDARERGRNIVSSEQQPAPATGEPDASGTADHPEPDAATASDADTDERPISTAEAAGMYDVADRAAAAEAANRAAVQEARAAESAGAAEAAESGEARDRVRHAPKPANPDSSPSAEDDQQSNEAEA